jgi:NAD(P)H-flavin reductase
MINSSVPVAAKIIDRIDETATIASFKLQIMEKGQQRQFSFQPGQFNMVYVYGVGEVPISIDSDPEQTDYFQHTIRKVGRVTRALFEYNAGATLGIRGPFGTGWPLDQLENKNVIVVTGGLGCAPVLGMVRYMQARRQNYGDIKVLQGVKHADDLLWESTYDEWRKKYNMDVHIAASNVNKSWRWDTGGITVLLDKLQTDLSNYIVLMCGPEGMMIAVSDMLLEKGVDENNIWVSLERNMKCAIGQCGHCQLGPDFLCKQGPVFNYAHVSTALHIKGL